MSLSTSIYLPTEHATQITTLCPQCGSLCNWFRTRSTLKEHCLKHGELRQILIPDSLGDWEVNELSTDSKS